jgi:Baseplate J-like protein
MAINTESIGLSTPAIDDRSEEQIYRQSQNVVANRSQGALNDFSDSSPLGVLLRAQAFTSAEVLFRANQVSLAAVLKLLELAGVRRRLGSRAIAALTFSLTSPRASAFNIPKGFEIADTSGAVIFATDELLTIPAGVSSGTISATATVDGALANLPAYTITQITQPLSFLASVVNLAAAQGGAAEESVEAAINRGLLALKNTPPVSAYDFEFAAEQLMGSGSKAKAIGLLGPDKVTQQAGAVHLFLLSSTGPANPAVIGSVFSGLSDRIMLGTSLYVSPMGLLQATGRITARILPGFDANVVADSLWAAYQGYLAPTAFNPGDTLLIQELGYALRNVRGLDYIEGVEVNGLALNVPMPNAYTLPNAFGLALNLVDAEGNIFGLSRGSAEPEDYDPT